jgi:LuxR family maltose regulon positive regulatory protein
MSASPSILTTKLYIPPPRRAAQLVTRPRLTARLHEGLTRRLTLISAAAGFGKTTLVGEWRASLGRDMPLAWLSLDDDDNDLARFLTYLVAALTTLGTTVGDSALAALKAPQPPPATAILTALINDLEALPQGCALVLDDYHVITAEAVHQALTFLLEHRPARLRLVILSRSDPPLPLARLRAQGELTEIRAADLRFTPAEATAFLNQVMALDLPADAVAALETRTEGWIAGLKLAALSMQARDAQGRTDLIAAFGGSHQYILDYLLEEVLNHQPEEVRSFLLQTSILSRLCGGVCDAVVAGDTPQAMDGQSMLERLEHMGLFVVPLDDERHWYRYHHIFREVLNRRLAHLHPQQLPSLHQRASAWHEANGLVPEAILHALAAGNQDRVIGLIEQHGCLLLIRGEVTTLLRWIAAVEVHADRRPWFHVFRAWAFALTGEVERAEAWLRQGEALLAEQEPAPDATTLQGTISAARAHCANLRGEAQLGAGYARQALGHLPDTDIVNCCMRTVATSLLGDATAMTGELEEARQAYAEAAQIGRAAGDVHLAIVLNSNLAGILVEQGQLRQAAALLSETLAMAKRPDGQRSVIAGRACIELSQIYYEWNRLEDAFQLAQQGLVLCQQWGSVELQAVGHGILARLEHAQGRPERAQAAILAAARLVDQYKLAPRHAVWVRSVQARLWMAQGNLQRACRLIGEAGITPGDEIDFLHEPYCLVLVRLLLAQGEYDSALALSRRLLETAMATKRTGRATESLLLQALALQGKDQADQALAILERAISLSEVEGFVRLFVDEGDPMARLLHRARAHRMGGPYLSVLLGAAGETISETRTPVQGLIEPLTPREREVLQLIADGCSNPGIAAKLVITIPTVKRHITNIYGKLGVRRRTQAIALGRELKLLH